MRFADLQRIYGAGESFGLAAADGEMAEIVLADQQLHAFTHDLHVRRVRQLPGKAAAESGRLRFPFQQVAVAFAFGGIAGVEVLPYRFRRGYADVRRQAVVHDLGQLFYRHRPVAVKAAALAQSVDPGVGASGADDGHGMAQDIFYGLFYFLLNGHALIGGLTLPAHVGGAVVFHCQQDVAHKTRSRMAPASSSRKKMRQMVSRVCHLTTFQRVRP